MLASKSLGHICRPGTGSCFFALHVAPHAAVYRGVRNSNGQEMRLPVLELADSQRSRPSHSSRPDYSTEIATGGDSIGCTRISSSCTCIIQRNHHSSRGLRAVRSGRLSLPPPWRHPDHQTINGLPYNGLNDCAANGYFAVITLPGQ